MSRISAAARVADVKTVAQVLDQMESRRVDIETRRMDIEMVDIFLWLLNDHFFELELFPRVRLFGIIYCTCTVMYLL